MKVKIQKLSEKAVIPKYESKGASGLDLVAVSERIDVEHGYISYGTGLAVQIPAGFEGQVRPRSSIRTKDLMLINSPGTIDTDYRGEIFVTFKSTRPLRARKYEIGERIAQLVIAPVEQAELVEVKELDKTERGTGSHGSTGA